LKTGIAAVKGGWRGCNVEKEMGEREREIGQECE
jgi:hypothetical protein